MFSDPWTVVNGTPLHMSKGHEDIHVLHKFSPKSAERVSIAQTKSLSPILGERISLFCIVGKSVVAYKTELLIYRTYL